MLGDGGGGGGGNGARGRLAIKVISSFVNTKTGFSSNDRTKI
jgi:hypothetical protein